MASSASDLSKSAGENCLEVEELRREVERISRELDQAVAEKNQAAKYGLGLLEETKTLKQRCEELETLYENTRHELDITQEALIKFQSTHKATTETGIEQEESLLSESAALESSLTLHIGELENETKQVEFEASKHETRRLQEEVDVLNEQLEELASLKKIAEKQLEETLENLQLEREAKYALKKELDQRINNESMYNLSNLAYSIRGNAAEGSDGEDELPVLKRIEEDLKDTELASPDGKQVDLFSEIHLNELKKLEKQLEQAENEKVQLTSNLRDAQSSLERSRGELSALMTRILQVGANVESLQELCKKTTKGDSSQFKTWFSIASNELEALHNALKELEKGLNCSDATLQLRTEVTNLKNKLFDAEQKAAELGGDVQALSSLAKEASDLMSSTHNNVITASEEVATLYHHVCAVNGESPSRVLLDHEKHGEIDSEPELMVERLPAMESLKNITGLCRNTETLLDQIKFLRSAVSNTIENKGTRIVSDLSVPRDAEAELQEQIIKLKSMLSSKREQIATLRTVLKSNKNTAEVALNNLKAKYENEKAIVSETMMKLRNELRLLKEDAATFSSLRAMFAARCEEYVTQVDELQRQLIAAEEEKKTLNQLLRLAVLQKLNLTQKLEELEVDRELRSARRTQAAPSHSISPRQSKARFAAPSPRQQRDFF
ncbi:Protein bicaudal D [Frankliniella fusca]|uniref:Protein bicaudal D n=1 Tax=Frankliniella fusca TaxID=407009 RepID=A0AAE1LP68_9NEOP|nr:Protein bicaudal D [Frankliniella fusca]